MQTPFNDRAFMRAIERWMGLQGKPSGGSGFNPFFTHTYQSPMQREAQAVFYGYMYSLWDDDQIVMDYLNTGAVDGYTWDCFKKARAKFYQKGLDEV